MKRFRLPKREGAGEVMLPRWAAPLVWAVMVAIIQVALPWVIAQIGPRYGWYERLPGAWNLAGLAAITAGIGAYTWCLANHYKGYTSSVRMGFAPPHLVIAGPYKYSRNPMYVSALFAWIGWTIFYGSPAVGVALVLLWSVFAYRVIPMEERQLEAMFGEEYREYKRRVQRWIGRD